MWRESRKNVKGRDYTACSEVKMGGTVKMNSVGGRRSKGGRAAKQSPTSNNLSLCQSQHACPLPLPATKQFSRPTSKAVSLKPIMFVLRALICFSELSKCSTTCYRFVSLNHFRQRWIFLKSAFPALEMSRSSQNISWNGHRAGKKNWLQGRNILLGRITKQQKVSIKCQNLIAMQTKQDQWACKTLGWLFLDKHYRWSCVQGPASTPTPAISPHPMQANVSFSAQHHPELRGFHYYANSNIWPVTFYNRKSSDQQCNKLQ